MEGAYYRCSVSSLSALFLAFPSTRGTEPSLVLWRSLRYSYTEPAGGSHTHTTSNLIGAFQISKNADPATRNWIHRHQALPLSLSFFLLSTLTNGTIPRSCRHNQSWENHHLGWSTEDSTKPPLQDSPPLPRATLPTGTDPPPSPNGVWPFAMMMTMLLLREMRRVPTWGALFGVCLSRSFSVGCTTQPIIFNNESL